MFIKYYTIFIGIVFFLILFLEGLSIKQGRDISYLLILCLPVLLYIFTYLRKKEIKYPKLFLTVLLILIAYEIINLFFSVNLESSFRGFMLLISYFFVFIYTYLNKDIITEHFLKYLNYAIYSLVGIFSIVNVIYVNKLPFIEYGNNFQYIYSPSGLHFHLGDLLLIPLVTNLYWLMKNNEKKYLFTILALLPFFILCFSRSAYLTFLVMGFLLLLYFKDTWLKFYKEKTFEIVMLFIILLAIIPFFIFGVSVKIGNITNDVNFYSKSKTIIGNRQMYFTAGFETIKQNPYFGIGLRNFVYGYEKNRSVFEKEVTYSSHNIFLDILVGNGIFGFIIFAILLFIFFKKSKKNIFFFLFLALLINYQTDYAFQIYSFLLIFFIFAGLSYEENKSISNDYISLIPTVLLFISLIIVLSNIFSSIGNYELSHILFPLDRENNKVLVNQYLADKNYSKALDLMEFNRKTHLSDINTLYFNLNIYNMFRNKKMEVNYNEYMCNASNNFDCYNYLYLVYTLDKNEVYKSEYKRMLSDFFQSWEDFYFTMKKNNQVNVLINQRRKVLEFCKKIYNGDCPFTIKGF